MIDIDMEMVENIQATSFIVAIACYVAIQAMNSDKMSNPQMFVILAGLFGGVTTAVVTSLMVIWA